MAEAKRKQYQRVSPIKPSLRGAGNWTRAQLRAASYSRKAMTRLVVSLVLIFSALVYVALWMGGHLPTVKSNINNFTQNRLMAMGFVVADIDVVGEGRIRERDVRAALGVYEGQYFFGADLKGAQDRIEGLNWVDTVVVRRLWPNRIVVEIIERDVFAVLQHNQQLVLIDTAGDEIKDVALEDFTNLPHFIGQEIGGEGQVLLTELSRYPLLSQRFTTFRRVGDRRWDLIDADAKMTVKLPVGDIRPSLQYLVGFQNEAQWLDRQISVIDMRVAGRISVRPLDKTQS